MMQEFIKTSLEYIEQNLRTDITADELAKMANYSAGHFCRIFAQTMDSTVAGYILKRRLDHALIEISSGRKAIDVMLEYGFDTYAGFYKAFVKMYGCSPKRYLSIYKKSEVLIMQNEKDLQTILGNWNITQGLKIEDASMRNWRTEEVEWQIWKIGEDLYLKTNERSIMIRNIRIAKALKKEGLISEFLPIPTKEGNDYLDGENIFMLTKKVGKPLNNRPLSDNEIGHLENNNLRAKHAYKLGQAIARFHRALKSVEDDVKPYEGNLYEQGKNAIPTVKKYEAEISGIFFDDYTENFSRLYRKLPKQLIHGNLCGDTAVYENDEVVGFKGFEQYSLSFPRLFDVTWAAGEINSQPLIDEYLKTLNEMLKGYDSVNPLNAEEKQSVYYILCATYLRGYEFCPETEENLDLTESGNRAMILRGNKGLVFLANNKEMFTNLID